MEALRSLPFCFSQSDMDKKQESNQPPAVFLDVKLFYKHEALQQRSPMI